MIASEKAERQKLLFQSSIFSDYLTGKFKEKKWSRLINSLGIGEPEAEYTKEDFERDKAESERVMERFKKARYERAI